MPKGGLLLSTKYGFPKTVHLSWFRAVCLSEQMVSTMTKLAVGKRKEKENRCLSREINGKYFSWIQEWLKQWRHLSFHTSPLALEPSLPLLGNTNIYKLWARISAGYHLNSPDILVSAYVDFIALFIHSTHSFFWPNSYSKVEMQWRWEDMCIYINGKVLSNDVIEIIIQISLTFRSKIPNSKRFSYLV